MNLNSKKKFLLGLFPQISPSDIENLLKKHNNINQILEDITKLKSFYIKIPIHQYLRNINGIQKSILKNQPIIFHYPEIFKKSKILLSDAQELREMSKEKRDRCIDCIRNMNKYSKEYYLEEIDNLNEQADKLDRQAALIIIKNMMDRNDKGNIDLHGLYTKEAVDFVEDYLKYYEKKVSIITGHTKGSTGISPAIIQYLESKGIKYNCTGPVIVVKERKK